MWLFTTIGFFSAVQKPGDDGLTIRARVGADLDRLRERYLPDLSPTIAGAGTDYPFRATIDHDAFGRGLLGIVSDLHYGNFKDAVAAAMGHERAHLYGEVWQTLLALEHKSETSARAAPEESSRSIAYGGVVIDDAGLVLLQEPRGHFGGYHWTFPKGRSQPGEAPAETALRETREETGVSATLVGALPGLFPGTTTDSVYFLLAPVAESGSWDDETSAIRWASREEAARLIAQTPNGVGRERDLRVLDAALAFHDARRGACADRPGTRDVDGAPIAPGVGTESTAPAPLLEVTVPGRAAVLTDPKTVADAWKWAVARAAGESWRGGHLAEECAIQLTFDLTPARFRDTALANLLKATIDGLSNQVFAPAPGGQPGPWSREDWRITRLSARKRLAAAGPAARIALGTTAPPWEPTAAPLADVVVPGSPPLFPGDQAGAQRVRAWRELLRQRLADALALPLADAADARIVAAFDFAIEPWRMTVADLDNFSHPAALAVGYLLSGQGRAAQLLVACHATKRVASSAGDVATRVRLWREA